MPVVDVSSCEHNRSHPIDIRISVISMYTDLVVAIASTLFTILLGSSSEMKETWNYFVCIEHSCNKQTFEILTVQFYFESLILGTLI